MTWTMDAAIMGALVMAQIAVIGGLLRLERRLTRIETHIEWMLARKEKSREVTHVSRDRP